MVSKMIIALFAALNISLAAAQGLRDCTVIGPSYTVVNQAHGAYTYSTNQTLESCLTTCSTDASCKLFHFYLQGDNAAPGHCYWHPQGTVVRSYGDGRERVVGQCF